MWEWSGAGLKGMRCWQSVVSTVAGDCGAKGCGVTGTPPCVEHYENIITRAAAEVNKKLPEKIVTKCLTNKKAVLYFWGGVEQ